MSPLFGPKYDDRDLVVRSEQALVEDPIMNAARIVVSSEKGIVTLGGTASSLEKSKAADIVRHALDSAGLKYGQVIDKIEQA